MGDKNCKEIFASSLKRDGTLFIQFLLDTGLDVNALNKFGKTMLTYAAEWGSLQVAEFLVQKGADANVVNSDGSKPLHIAAQYGRKDIVKFFLDRGISADSCDEDRCTPLHYVAAKSDISSAERENYQELVHIFVDGKADIDAVNSKGCTPLLLAAQTSRKYMVELFIKCGANLECCDEYQWTVLHHACEKGWTEVVWTLVEGRFEIDLNARTSNGSTPMAIAAENSLKDIVKLLVKSGADIENKDIWGDTLLHCFCRKGWLEGVKYLVSIGCDLNAKNIWGGTPMMWAAGYSHLDVIDYLIECGADVKCCDEDGQTLLHLACMEGLLEEVKSLTEKGCDVNAKTVINDTPLHLAIQNYNLEIIKHLLIAGADCNVVNNKGKTAFNEFLQKSPCLEVIALFFRRGAYIQSDDYAIICNNSLLKEGILQNAHLCTVALLNKFNNADLPKIYNIPSVSERLPRIENLKNSQSMEQDIAESVKYEIQTKGYCNVLNVRPIVLRRLCILTLGIYNS